MKILFVGFSDLSLQRGSTTHVVELVRNLRARGHEVTIIAQASSPLDRLEGFHRAGGYMTKKGDVRRFLGLLKSMAITFALMIRLGRQADVIYVRDAVAGFLACLSRPLHRRKFVLELNGLDSEDRQVRGKGLLNALVTAVFRFCEDEAFPRANGVVTVSPRMKAFVAARYALADTKCGVIGNGVDTELFSPRTKNPALMTELGLRPDDFVVGFVGSLAPWQGLDTLMDAVPALADGIPRLKVLVVGSGDGGARLEGRARSPGLQGKIVLAGETDYRRVPDCINLFDVAAAPFDGSTRNRKRGFSPIKIFEYMACGKPFVTTSTFEMDEAMAHGDAGRVVPPDDPAGFARAVIDIHSDPARRQAMSANGVRLAREHYSWSRAAAEVEREIRKALAP